MQIMLSSIFILTLLIEGAQSWMNNIPTSPTSQAAIRSNLNIRLYSTTEAPAVAEDQSALAKQKRDRYVATNRFSVRKNQQAKFEKRWATRKSKLASLEGFRYFHLMRRVSLNDDNITNTYLSGHEDTDEIESNGNYVSFTIWKEKKHFNAWRNGEAFKEAHGGTSVVAFVSTMINSALVLDGPPRPAFYDGLLLQAMDTPEFIPETEDGWRKTNHDFEQLGVLPAECFVACNQFFVPNENAAEFEARWAGRSSVLKECDGFVSFSLLRRDNKAKGHGTVPMDETEPTYVSTTIWRDRAAFEGWRNGNAFKVAHGQKKEGGNTEPPRKPLWSKPPSPIFYEGTLVISSEEGA